MTRKRFNKLRRTLCIQVEEHAKKGGYNEVNKKAHLCLNKMPTPVGIGNGKSYQECWNELIGIINYLPISEVKR